MLHTQTIFTAVLVMIPSFGLVSGDIEGFPISNCQFGNCLQVAQSSSAIIPTPFIPLLNIHTCNHSEPRQQFAYLPNADGRIASIYNPGGVGKCLTVGSDVSATTAPNNADVTVQTCTPGSLVQQWDQQFDEAFWYQEKYVCLKYKNRGSGLCLANDATRTYAYTCDNQYKNEFYHYAFALCPQ